MMTTASFIDRFEALSAIRAIRQTTNFQTKATVEADLSLLDAVNCYALSGQLQARWFRAIRARDKRILWLFEDEADAMPFADKFRGDLKGPVSIATWQK